MKNSALILLFVLLTVLLSPAEAAAQCSICTKTAQQLGEKPAKGLNAGILYLAFAPMLIVSYIGYKWWKGNKDVG